MTINTFYDFADTNADINDSHHKFNLLSAWLCGDVYTNCLLSDITRTDASILMPKNCTIPSKVVYLLIISPEYHEVMARIRAVPMWTDDVCSAKYKKLVLGLQNIDERDFHAIDSIINHFAQRDFRDIRCNLFATSPH